MHLDSYISGFVDGEGCFCVSFQPSKRHCLGWEVRPSFSVSQNADRAQLLYVIKEKWNCGFVRPDRSDRTIKFEVRNVGDLVSKVIPHFRANPLMSSKQNDFDRFAISIGGELPLSFIIRSTKEHDDQADEEDVCQNQEQRRENNSAGRRTAHSRGTAM